MEIRQLWKHMKVVMTSMNSKEQPSQSSVTQFGDYNGGTRCKTVEIIKNDLQYKLHIEEFKRPDITIDRRSGKYIVICSLDFNHHDEILSLLFDIIEHQFEIENGRLPDKIYVLKLSEADLSFGVDFFTQVIDKAFWFSHFHAVETTKQDIPPELVFINGDLAVTTNVKEYSKHQGVNISDIKSYGFPFSLLLRTRKRLIELNASNKIADYHSRPTKHFICLNGNPVIFRIRLVTWLHKTNIIDKCHWSWLRRGLRDLSHEKNMAKSEWTELKVFDFLKTKELDMSLEDLDTHINQDIVSDFYYLTDSLIDIGSETSPIQNQFITEKTWKPYLLGKVSFFFNNQSYYSILKNLGFELYDEIFDYSFDTIKDDDERLVGYYNELKRISEIPIEELRKKILSIEDKILRNKNHAWNCDVYTIPILKEYPMLVL